MPEWDSPGKVETALALEKEAVSKINNILRHIDGIKDVRVNVIPFETGD